MEKIYIIMCYGGSYDDHFSYPKKTYLDEEKANLFVEKANEIFPKLEEFYRERLHSLSENPIEEEDLDLWDIYTRRLDNYSCSFRVQVIEITN